MINKERNKEGQNKETQTNYKMNKEGLPSIQKSLRARNFFWRIISWGIARNCRNRMREIIFWELFSRDCANLLWLCVSCCLHRCLDQTALNSWGWLHYTWNTAKTGIFENDCTENTAQLGSFKHDCTESTAKTGIFENDCTETLQKLGVWGWLHCNFWEWLHWKHCKNWEFWG